jgi:hypothetical protein
MKKHSFLILLLGFIVLGAAACKDPEEPGDPNEEELITKVQLSFVEAGNPSNAFTVTYSDPDGDGGNNPVQFDSISLDSGKVYNVSIALFDESNPADIENITTEVQAEAAEHLFCYTSSGANVVVQRTDSDGTYEIGIQSTWTAGAASSGTMRIELKHQPDGQKNGSCNVGATDVQLDFTTVVR